MDIQDEQKLEALLTVALYRGDCPESAALGTFQMGWLPQTERASIQAHLKHCPHCRAELARLSKFLVAAEEPGWIQAAGFMWSHLRETGEVIIRLLSEVAVPPVPRLALASVKGHTPGQEADVLRRIELSAEETGGADIVAVVQRSQADPQQCTLVVRVQLPSRWPDLKGTLIQATAGNWQAEGQTDDAGEVILEGMPVVLLDALSIHIRT